MGKDVALVYLDIPTCAQGHIYNLAIIQFVLEREPRGAYFLLRGDTLNLTVRKLIKITR